MNMYSFVIHAATGSLRDVLAWEREAQAKQGGTIWSPRCRVGEALPALGILAVVLFAIGGFAGLAAGYPQPDRVTPLGDLTSK